MLHYEQSFYAFGTNCTGAIGYAICDNYRNQVNNQKLPAIDQIFLWRVPSAKTGLSSVYKIHKKYAVLLHDEKRSLLQNYAQRETKSGSYILPTS